MKRPSGHGCVPSGCASLGNAECSSATSDSMSPVSSDPHAPREDGGRQRDDQGAPPVHAYPKNARATSENSFGTVLSSATASRSDTSTIVSPWRAAITPQRPS